MTDELKPCPFCVAALKVSENPVRRDIKSAQHPPGDCILSGQTWWYVPRFIGSWNIRADLATPAPAVKVKALVWAECNSGNFKQGHCFTARSMVDFAPIAVHKKADGWWLNKDCTTYPTIDAAKAAAQADYEARIASALEPATLLDDPRGKALVDALEQAKIMLKERGFWDIANEARAALSALEENK